MEKLMVYGKTACEEILFPMISQISYSFHLDKERFHLGETIDIFMQVMDGAWCFAEQTLQHFERTGNLVSEKTIFGRYFEVKNPGRDRIAAGCRKRPGNHPH